MKIAKAIAAAAAALATGCFSLETGKIGSSGEEHALVANYGWYLFHFIPIACGNANWDSWFPWALFRNDVTMDKIQSHFMRHAGERGMTAHDLAYTTSESVMLNIPGVNLPLPVPYLITYREIQLSGTHRRPPPDAAAGEEAAP